METEEITTSMKIFGKNASEFLTNTVGTVLALVNIGLAAWDLYSTTDPLEKAMDSLNIASGSLSVIGIAAGWIAGSVEEGIDIGIMITCETLEMVAAWMGPLSVVLAVGELSSL